MSWRVFITARVMDEVGRPALQILTDAGCEVVIAKETHSRSPEELIRDVSGYDATLATTDRYTAEALAHPALARLKIISRWGVGFDSIDTSAAARLGIPVAYTPGLLNEAVADCAFALLLGIARRIHTGHLAMMANQWKQGWGHDVFGKTLGLVGCGRIGQAMAKRGRGFEMRLLGYDLNPTPEAIGLGIEFVSLDELLAQSDFVSLHAAVTPQSRGMMGEAQFRRMKPTAYLVNTARGALVDESALVRALNEGWIAGAGLDVYAVEPPPADHPLRTAKNALLTPHQCSFARETGLRVSAAAAQAIVDLLQGRKPRWVVDESVWQSPALRAKFP
jgi:phosphoglycerate dehydrogenase-like enzyme